MKKLLFTALFACTFAGSFAQRYTRSYGRYDNDMPTGIRYGIKGGVNLAGVRLSPNPGNLVNGLTAFHAGVFAQVPVSSRVSFQPELLYSQQGFGVVNGLGKVTFNYLSLPLLGKLHLTDNVSVVVGPQVSYLANSRVGLNRLISLPYRGVFQSVDFSGVAGAEVDLGPLVVGGRYNLGFNNLNKNFNLGELVQLNNFFRIRNSTFQLSLGYKF